MKRQALFWPLVAALGVALGGCSTHEFRFEGDVPPPPLTAKERADTAHEIVLTLLERFAKRPRTLPTSAVAPLAEAAVIDAIATRSLRSLEAGRPLARSLLGGRIPVGVGLAYPGADRRRPDPQVTIEAARTLLSLDQRLNAPLYRSAATRAAQAIITPRLGWTALRGGYAVREPGARRRYSVALTADAGLVLTKLAGVGGGPTAERYGREATRLVVRSQIARGRWHKSLGGRGAMPVAEWAVALYALHTLPSRSDQELARAALPALFETAFHSWGEPRRSRLVGKRGLGPPLALRALLLDPGSSLSEHVTRWAVAHRRPDGTFEDAPADDATAQAYYALAFAFRSYIFTKGGLP